MSFVGKVCFLFELLNWQLAVVLGYDQCCYQDQTFQDQDQDQKVQDQDHSFQDQDLASSNKVNATTEK